MIKFSNVSLIYPNSTTTVLENLNLEISEGEMVLVIGPTGSGKSSLLRLINGLVPHHTGGILAGDVSVDGHSTQLVKPGGMAHLIGIPASWFLPGFLRGIEGLSQPVLLAAVLVEPTTLVGVVTRERPVNRLAPFAIFGSTALFGGPLAGPSPMLTLPLSGYVITSLRGCGYRGLVGSGCFI